MVVLTFRTSKISKNTKKAVREIAFTMCFLTILFCSKGKFRAKEMKN